ncbi:N-alpha-acetyltransferase 25,NatB auxiliary subunit [Lachnellula occidentalis]|uniref:N-alpha-acetyltransferase 25,NatB auxiliary subunit n=1 Tax=Lachnellula occidentalis TaxID=215460 RepID=A0A8H8RHB0_9HELO|nr:N-alpha-acetyltransferase 25,NatB auxiliary subunit [Lachnellula occidentalis]
MADQMLKDRQDAPIWNAIDASNFKQALKLVDKRLAKKRSDYLEALKVYIRSRSPLLAEKQAVLLHLEELAEKKKAIADLETVELYDEAFGEVLPEPQESWDRIIGELRWQCVKSQPKNEDLSLKCFQACLGKGDLEHAKQISNSLEKTFSNNHSYVFWNIASMFLYSISEKYPEKQRKLWGSLAFAQIGKLATATKQATDPKKLPIRSIQTPQELLLLHRITEALGKPEQRLEYLNDPTLGPESAVAKGEWQLWRFKLKLLENAAKWQELFETTKSLLKRARTKDESGQLSESGMSDWIVWEAFIRSAVELRNHEPQDAVIAEVEAHLDPKCEIDKSWKRNASLALVKITFVSSSPFQDQPHDRIPVIIKYLQKYGNASTAYNDLRPFVEQLNVEDRKQLLELILKDAIFEENQEDKDFKTANRITQLINTYKLRYLLTSSLPECEIREGAAYNSSHKDSAGKYSASSLKQLAQDAAKLYLAAVDGGRSAWNLLPTDTHPADDLCLLSAMCLFKLALANTEDSEPLSDVKASYVLQATALLEYALTHSQPNFQMSLLLIRLYFYLGCGSMAMHAYQRLGLKQVQLDTLSYTLFDRISTFHPHPFSHSVAEYSSYRTPMESLQKQQKMYRSSRDQISKNIWLSYKHGSYNSIFEIKEVSDTLSRTLSAVMSVVESRKISSLIPSKTGSGASNGGFDILPPNPEALEAPFSDTNDYETFPNFECTRGPRFEELCRFVPVPSDYRTRINLAADKLTQLLQPIPDDKGGKAASQAALQSFLGSPSEKFPKSSINLLTQPEELTRQIYDAMDLIIQDACDPERWSGQKFREQLDSHNKELCESLEEQRSCVANIKGPVPALSSTLHALYTGYESGKTALKFSVYLSSKGKDVQESQAEANTKIAEVAQRLLQAVADKSLAIKKGLDEGGLIDKVLDSVLQGPDGTDASVLGKLRDSVDESHLELWAGDVVESWRDSVAGLSYLKT